MVNQLLTISFGGWPHVLLFIPWETKVALWCPTTSHKTNWWWFAQLMLSDSFFKMPPISWNWLKIRLIHSDSWRWAVSTIFATDTFDLMQLATGCTFWAFIWRHIMSGKYHCKYPITHRVSENSKSGWEKMMLWNTRIVAVSDRPEPQKMEMWVNGKTSNTLCRSFSRCSQFAGNTEIQAKGESSSSSCCRITALACSVIENSDGGQWGGGRTL